MFSLRQSLTSLAVVAQAAQRTCGAAGAVSCTAGQLLHWLYVVAAVLALILVLVIALAIRIWRKNKDADSDR